MAGGRRGWLKVQHLEICVGEVRGQELISGCPNQEIGWPKPYTKKGRHCPEWPAVRKDGAYLLKQGIAHRPAKKRKEVRKEGRLFPEWPAGWKEGAYPTKRIAHRPANKSKEVSK